MVRQAKQTPEQKKESQKRKTTQKKKVTETGVWPCKIDGCNKQFAREADLKRHQRTTKLHSVPGFACPQCDATFTRTDALRRHQKSRHNGVIIEPTEVEKKKGSTEPRASGSQSHSRSPSPSSKGAENPTDAPPPLGVLGGSQVPHSYYRQHTMPAGAYMPPPLGVIVEGQYPPNIGLPTSSARLHQATWPQGAWIPDGSQPPPMPPMGYPHPAYYSYYRGMPHPSPGPPPSELMSHLQNGVQPHSPSSCDDSSSTSSPTRTSMHNGGDPSASGAGNFHENEARSPVIDPSLDISPVSPTTNHKVSFKVNQTAVEVALSSTEREPSHAPDNIHSPSHVDPRSVSHPSSSASTGESPELFYAAQSPPHTHTFERPPEMEHMLTEDGEPMLNPAELLTQESLASPPPSL
ncbi:hypothetical protein DFJ58DRAFT_810858 [Suillus subalutaceus]|uniref:uncharacterized protein n=1 Tax=Suillus subalutaceus TaxID=48586 RepID=UPI001B872B45|nr:uncharacterized protein DFJ58DRAFT_810858 [Suillus subalutaceus]KAG1840292.1 hypothetical protein DFJ58DRAFT_810858 [Suillus subalutaceus]